MKWSEEQEQTIQQRLNTRLERQHVKEKPGRGGGKNQYMETNVAISLANEIFGFNGWNTEIQDLREVKLDFMNNKWVAVYSCKMKVTLKDGTVRSDVGIGEKEMTKLGDAVDAAQKEAVSDAIKRCLRQFGDGLGNCLYNEQARKEIMRPTTKNKPIPQAPTVKTQEKKEEGENVSTMIDEWNEVEAVISNVAKPVTPAAPVRKVPPPPPTVKRYTPYPAVKKPLV